MGALRDDVPAPKKAEWIPGKKDLFRPISVAELRAKLREEFPKKRQVLFGITLCSKMHVGQTRESGDDYFSGHVAPVTLLALELARESDALTNSKTKLFGPLLALAALGHDAPENQKDPETRVRYQKILRGFLGQQAGDLVALLTKPVIQAKSKAAAVKVRKARDKEYYAAMAASPHAKLLAIIKLADRIQNLVTLHGISDERRRKRIVSDSLALLRFFEAHVPEHAAKLGEAIVYHRTLMLGPSLLEKVKRRRTSKK